LYCIVYSPNKYRETEGIKDIGSHFWNAGRTEEIRDRFVHLDDQEYKGKKQQYDIRDDVGNALKTIVGRIRSINRDKQEE